MKGHGIVVDMAICGGKHTQVVRAVRQKKILSG